MLGNCLTHNHCHPELLINVEPLALMTVVVMDRLISIVVILSDKPLRPTGLS